MATAVKDQLWRLIKSLNKAEKRNFKLYATRAGATTDNKFIQLFDVLDRLEGPDDNVVTTRLRLSPGQYSNLKRHLYQQVLTSLRLIYINKEIDIELREQIDFSHILYGKGLYLDALRSLERAKSRAVEHNRDVLHLEILEFQKLIESRHITLSRQVDNKMDLLLNESAERSYSVLNTSELFNLNIQIHGRYIETGHSRSEKDRLENKEFWDSIQTHRFDRETVGSTFHQKINRFQASMWYHYIQLNFEDALESAMNALMLFHLSTHMTVKDPDLYLRCLYYVSVFAYLCGDEKRMQRYLSVTQRFLADEQIQLNENSQLIGQVYVGLMQLNTLFATGKWEAAKTYCDDLRARYANREFVPTDHRWGQFLYKFAATAFIRKQYAEALDYLNEIINMKTGILREDLLLNTRLLHLLCHYELGNRALVDYHLTNFKRQMRRSAETAAIHHLCASALRKLIKSVTAEHPPIFEALDRDLRVVASNDPFEHKALLYLDLTHWVRQHLGQRASDRQRSSGPALPYGVSPSAPPA
ncbi:hypothetical protein CLV84_1906 [Neolewinella xylanilytica]|uniref:Tetratricopeptide repeat protein n=1 Tax=Neolewinella xylanilytica TaxID=1514080 RepID=A0A2S6IBU0_9BACT|nr:hypothetical protein [Neolewinella xylanilytica]PPK88932.1 hypothetical protein CLV84_1906 [Neolewinella xylanilytica]